MAARTLEEQHKLERDYLLGKTNKTPNGKLVSTEREKFLEESAAHEKKMERLMTNNSANATANINDTGAATLQPITTVAGNSFYQIQPELPTKAENAAETASTGKSERVIDNSLVPNEAREKKTEEKKP